MITFNGRSKVVSAAPDRIVVHIDGRKEGVFLAVRRTSPENPVRNIRLSLPGMGGIRTQYLDSWKATGGDFVCRFSSAGQSSKWGSWELLEGADATTSPKFNAVLKWKQANSK